MTDANLPGKTVGLRADNANITAEIDEAVLCAKAGTDVCRAVSCVFFAETAKIEFHARLVELELAVREGYPVEANKGQYGVNRSLIGKREAEKSQTFRSSPEVMSKAPPLFVKQALA